MPKRYRGVVRGGVVVLEPDAQLREGAEVEVIEHTEVFQPDWDAAWHTVGIARDREGRTDVSERVDEYLAEAYRKQNHP